MTTFHYTRDTQRGVESLIVAGEVVKTIPSTHPHFVQIRDYCFDQDRNHAEIDMEHVLSLYNTEQKIAEEFLRITDRVSFRGGKLLWDGEPTEGALADHIVHMVKSHDDNYTAFALFLENLAQNPSPASRAALFEWIADRRFTITEDGCFVGYKGVRDDYRSIHSGYGIVNGVEMTDMLPNDPGNVVEVPRGQVDADRDSACSYGLHVGTRRYATSYGTKMIIVAVNPRDVVMVPRDGGGEKMRVCKYTVLGDNAAELTTTTYNGSHRAADEEEASTSHTFEDECEECGCPLNSNGACTCCGDEEEVRGYCASCGANTDAQEYCEDCQTYCERCDMETNGTSLCPDCEFETSDDEEDEEDEEEEVCEYCGGPLDEDGDCPDE